MSTFDSDESGRKLSNFEILDEIGQGGMGVVYLARQPALERMIVLKKIRGNLRTEELMVQRFELEARAAATVHHQNVVAVYDCFTWRGDHYIAQEFVSGSDLKDLLFHVGRVEPQIAALIALEIARGLEEIHARGIVHRDLKPANILMGCGGEVKIADFGIALDGNSSGLTRPGTLMGSVPYMSPEQLLGKRVDLRSDIFLFGILLYEMLNGVTPFTPDAPLEQLLEEMQLGQLSPPRERGLHVPRYLMRKVRACLQANPNQRPQSVTDLRRLLERRLGNVSPADCRRRIADYLVRKGLVEAADVQTQVQPIVQPLPKLRARRLHWAVPAAAATLLLVAVGLYGHRDGDVTTAAIRGQSPLTSNSPAPPPAAAEVDDVVESDERVPPDGTGDDGEPSEESIAAPEPVALDPAQVRFVASPWAAVQIGDLPAFHTPRAAAVELEPGSHVVVFEHPTFGRAEYTLTLEPGERQVLRHVYEGAAR